MERHGGETIRIARCDSGGGPETRGPWAVMPLYLSHSFQFSFRIICLGGSSLELLFFCCGDVCMAMTSLAVHVVGQTGENFV